MKIRNLFRRSKTGDPVAKVADSVNLNIVYNILEDIEGEGGIVIQKPAGLAGHGWKIVNMTSSIQQAERYPWGDKWNFGIDIEGDRLTVYDSVIHIAGVSTHIAEKNLNVTSAAWLSLVYDPVDRTPDLQLMPTASYPWPEDAAGYVVRPIHRFAFDSGTGTATLDYCTMFDGNLNMPG